MRDTESSRRRLNGTSDLFYHRTLRFKENLKTFRRSKKIASKSLVTDLLSKCFLCLISFDSSMTCSLAHTPKNMITIEKVSDNNIANFRSSVPVSKVEYGL